MTSRGTRKARVWTTLVLSFIAVAVAGGAVAAGVIESAATTQGKAVATALSKPAPLSRSYPAQQTAAPTRRQPSSAPPVASPETSTPVAEVPGIVQTLPAVPVTAPPVVRPSASQTAQQRICPSGTVISGLTDVTVTGERDWIVGTLIDFVGQGAVKNGTSASVDVSLSLPYIQGLDATGRLTTNSFSGDFDYNPPPGQPRPSSVSLAPGDSLTYTFAAKDVSSKTVAATVAWYSDPKYTVYGYSDTPSTLQCPPPPISSPPGGPSIMNTYVPRSQ